MIKGLNVQNISLMGQATYNLTSGISRGCMWVHFNFAPDPHTSTPTLCRYRFVANQGGNPLHAFFQSYYTATAGNKYTSNIVHGLSIYIHGIVPFAQLMLLSAVLRPLAELPSITCTQLKNHLETSLNLAIAVHDIVAINNAAISC